ncbi:MAG: DNA mismatch repair protein MutS [Ruminiclostridium sp.]|jgi:DNA mismatch repair protein MutS|nr:DNA mismatch repair protein MutS [Ruminiclostridium sp.]
MTETPMKKQYREVKEKHPDCLLFFRLGDFYELFNDDAHTAAKELNLTLTTRDRNKPPDQRTPMCGVPYHAAEGYIHRLIKKGYKVAICEQTEDPSAAKGLVERKVIRVVTPGTLREDSFLSEEENNFLAALCVQDQGAGLCLGDLSTGEVYLTIIPSTGWEKQAASELSRFAVKEVILSPMARNPVFLELLEQLGCRMEAAGEERFDWNTGAKLAQKQFETIPPDLPPWGLSALGALLDYLFDTQKTELSHINTIQFYENENFLDLDPTARRNLELVETLRGQERKGSLLWVFGRCATPMGSRLLRSWVERPLVDPELIQERLDAVTFLLKNPIPRGEISQGLKEIADLERMISRILTANPRELLALARSLEAVPPIRALLPETGLLGKLALDLFDLTQLSQRLRQGIADDPPASPKDGGVIRPGFSQEIDHYRDLLSNSQALLRGIEERERERSGIRSLKIGYNKVFGYYIEVSKANYSLVPDHFIRKQTLVNSERFITQELKELEEEILTAQEKLEKTEYQLFTAFRGLVQSQTHLIQSIAQAVARLDVLLRFAITAERHGYCLPQVDRSGEIHITGGRHPVVEQVNEVFVPNDTHMDLEENLAAIITGPNMAGKSTYMRQVALIVIMAQMGSYVPARAARIGVVDKIFTRIGASDDLSGGKSTFMVEMNEVAQLLQRATRRSLLILDEIGRGTSTYDGMSIARAVLEWCADAQRLGARTLFATHYHELTVLEGQLSGVKNYNIAAKKKDGEIVFLRKILPGGADQSYGIEVAQLAGLPPAVIARARSILQELERGEGLDSSSAAAASDPAPASPPPLEPGEEEVLQALRNLSLDALSPIQALNLLFTWKGKV